MKMTCAAIVAAGLSLAGCATMVTGTSEDIAVLTPPVPGATCVLSNAEGSWTVVTPTVAHVQRGHEPLQVDCSSPGYADAHATIPAQFENWTIGDAATAGLGVAVDAYTGAISQYPHSIQLPMQPVPAVPPQAQAPVKAPATEAKPAN
jgi:predicted small secreted protein